MKKLIRAEIDYFIKTKLVFMLIILFGAYTLLSSFMLSRMSSLQIDNFERNITRYEESGDDIEESIQQGYSILESGTIENPIAYYHSEAQNLISYILPKNIPASFFQLCIISVPVLSVLLAAILVSCDEKNHTKKLKVARSGKLTYHLSKRIAGLLLLFFILIVSFLLLLCFNCFFYKTLSENYDLSYFHLRSYSSGVLLRQFAFTVLSAFWWFEVCYVLCDLIRNYVVVCTFITLCAMFFKPFSKYDPINAISTIEQKLFTFDGVIHPGKPIPSQFGFLVAEIIAILVTAVMIHILVNKRRSAFS